MYEGSSNTDYNSFSIHYYAKSSKIYVSNTIYINGSDKGVIKHFTLMSALNSNYSSGRKYLFFFKYSWVIKFRLRFNKI